MARRFTIHIWKKAPFVRLALPFIGGILLQHYSGFSSPAILIALFSLGAAYFGFRFLNAFMQFKNAFVRGLVLSGLIAALGMWVTYQKDSRNHPEWYGHQADLGDLYNVWINEPPVEKAKTYKALVRVESILKNGRAKKSTGEFIIYFSKDSLSEKLKYGNRLLLKKALQPIKNSGNPGGFDYKQYLAFQQVYHQVFLKSNEWKLIKGNKANPFKSALFRSREYVLNTIEKFIVGTKQSGLAKALLIGYRVDLERDLVQAYSNAGVVHLIAISGLHMALIYGLLLWVAFKIPFLKKSIAIRTITILLCLWFFAFLTGAPPSVMRAAVMFSFIAAGSLFKKNSSVFNSLATSGFVLLCFDPYLVWNVGFQLSYLAVLGIVILQKPVYNWFIFKNKALDYTWQIASVSISAQVFTIPICFYYFHQLPVYFIVANIISIPLATLALWGLIALAVISPIALIAVVVGKIVSGILWLMNQSVLMMNQLPFALWENVTLSFWSTLLLYGVFTCFIYFLLKKNTTAFKAGLGLTLVFTAGISFYKWQAFSQKTMIVYNIPAQNAVDFIYGNKYRLVSDPGLPENKVLYNFHLKPSRILLQAHNNDYKNEVFYSRGNFYQFFDKRMVIVDTLITYNPTEKLVVDYILLTKNPKVKIADLLSYYDCKQFIFSASNSMWKIGEWKKECKELHLRFHSVSEQGAYVTAF